MGQALGGRGILHKSGGRWMCSTREWGYVALGRFILLRMSIFANVKHRVSAYRTYFRIAKVNQDLFHELKQTRVAREANVGEDELAEAFETINGAAMAGSHDCCNVRRYDT
jgi:hypothetical protein